MSRASMTGSGESPQDAYDRGEIAGQIAARLAAHDAHFAKINGSIEKSADAQYQSAREVHDMKLQMQRLGDQLAARDATAAVVKDVDKERRDEVETKWSRIVRLVSLVGWLVAACLAIALLILH